MAAPVSRSYVAGMTTQTLAPHRPPGGATAVGSATAAGDHPGRGRPSLAGLGADLAYLTTGFFLSLLSFIVLVPLFTLGLSTAVFWIGLPILGFTLLTASGFARENRELLRRRGTPVADPTYRRSPRRPVLGLLLDPHAWLALLHGTLIALPLRITTFVVPVTWLAGGLGGVTWFVWAVFLPDEEYNGLGWLLSRLLDVDLSAHAYLVEASTMFIGGAILLATAPLVTRLCAAVDGGVARATLGG